MRVPEIAGTAEVLELHRLSTGDLILGTFIRGEDGKDHRVDITIPASQTERLVERLVFDTSHQLGWESPSTLRAAA